MAKANYKLAPRNADSFRADLHPDLKADLVSVRKDLANPPFNTSDWGGENVRRTRDLLLPRLLSGSVVLTT
jgi:type I restriction-modification system DNA methylase subunit